MKTILAFGDSNTFGLHPGDHSRFDIETRWTGILGKMISPYGFRVVEEGLCGRTTIFNDTDRKGRSGIDILPVLLESHQPLDYVIIMLGTNDCKTAFHASAEDITNGMRQIISEVRLKSPAKILLISPIHLGEHAANVIQAFDSRSLSVSKQLKEKYSELAEEENCLFLAASDYASPSESDCEHMEASGHKALAEAIFNKLYADISE
ncbi:MAG: GDSL-type esterase/lipase family protein [Porcipelethomonas sp.]